MTESEFPRFMYHREKGAFLCPSLEFLNSLTDVSEYEELPFTGPRSAAPKKVCQACQKLKLELIDVKLEVERLRLALTIEGRGESEEEPEETIPYVRRGRPKSTPKD